MAGNLHRRPREAIAAGSGVGRIDLHASAMGEPPYRSFGIDDPVEPELRWRVD